MTDKIRVLHNNSCSKSRAVLEYLDEYGVEFEVHDFISNPLSFEDLKEVIQKTGTPLHQVIRKGEPLFREKFQGREFSDDEWIQILLENPSLIQRPILVKGSVAVIGRPIENVRNIIEE